MIIRFLVATSFLILSSIAFADVPKLSLEAYLAEVKEKHLGYKAHVSSSQGARDRVSEGELLTSANLFANVQYLDDQKPTNNPAFQGNRTVYEGYSFGVAKQTRFGLLAKLSYNITQTDLRGTSPAFVPVPKFYTAAPMLEISQALWRNGFGSETRATLSALESATKASSYADSFKAKLVLAEAEGAYWRLGVAQEIVGIQKEGVERARKIRDWSARRARLQLADKSDELQAESGLQAKELELQMALDEERDAARNFNSMRGVSNDAVLEVLNPIEATQLEALEAVSKKGRREDVLAADELRKATTANTELGRDKNSPNLDVVSSLSLNGRDVSFGKSANDAFKTNQATFAVGLKFSTPLDLGTISQDRSGYLKEERAAEFNYQRKIFEETQDWQDLNRRFSEAKRRLKMAIAIEKIQQQKLEHEKGRMKTGRSVLYQVLSFEQDFANSQIMRVRTEAEILKIVAQMKTHLSTGEF